MGAVGTRYGDRYVLGPVLGWGGSAKVHRAHDDNLERDVALKIVHLDDEDALARLQREAAVAARVQDGNVVAVLDAGTDPEPFVVMQLVEGRTLAEIVKDSGPLTPSAVVELALGLLTGSAAIHEAGVVHRDINPNNVLIDHEGRARITDFGLAKGAGDAAITDSGLVLGTAAFVAPERRRGRDADEQSDLYEIGATLYFAATGQALDDGAGRLPDGLAVRTLLEHLLQRNPDDRPKSARAAIEELPAGSTSSTAHLTTVVDGAAAATTRVITDTADTADGGNTDNWRRVRRQASHGVEAVRDRASALSSSWSRRAVVLIVVMVLTVVAILALPSADPSAPPAYDPELPPAENVAELADWLDAVTDE